MAVTGCFRVFYINLITAPIGDLFLVKLLQPIVIVLLEDTSIPPLFFQKFKGHYSSSTVTQNFTCFYCDDSAVQYQYSSTTTEIVMLKSTYLYCNVTAVGVHHSSIPGWLCTVVMDFTCFYCNTYIAGGIKHSSIVGMIITEYISTPV